MSYNHMFRDILEVITKEDLMEEDVVSTNTATTPPVSSDTGATKTVVTSPQVPQENIPTSGTSRKVTDVNYNVNQGADEFAPEVEEEPLDPEMIGKIYIMKKIYVRLLSLDKILQNFVNPKYDGLRDDVSEAIEMFNTIALNFDSFQDKMDDLITMYQNLVIRVLDELKNVKST